MVATISPYCTRASKQIGNDFEKQTFISHQVNTHLGSSGQHIVRRDACLAPVLDVLRSEAAINAIIAYMFMENLPQMMRLHARVMLALSVTKTGDLPPSSSSTAFQSKRNGIQGKRLKDSLMQFAFPTHLG